MADENITSADTQEGAQQQATDAQLLDDLTSLQQATEGMDEAQADGQVATNNEGDADNPSMTRPDDEFKDQRGLPEGGTTDTFALDNTDLQNSNEQSTTTDLQFTAQNTTQDATAINLDNVQIEIDGAEGQQGSSGATRGSTSASPTTTVAPPTVAPTTLSDPVSPTPTLAPPTVPTTPTPAPTSPTTETPPSGTEESDGGENSSSSSGALTLTKSATVVNDADQVIDSDADDVRYEISLTNTGTIALNNVRVEDTMFEKLYVENATVGQVNVLDEEGEPVGGALIIQKDDSTYYVEVQRVDVSATVKLSYLIDIEDSDITAAFDDADNEDDVDNTATVTGADENLDPANLTDDAEVRVAKGALTLTKSATVVNDADQVIDSDADDVRYEISLTNTGTIALNNVRVEDTMFEKLYVENATVGQVNVLDEEGEPVGGALIIQKDDSTYYVEVQRVDVSATVKLSYLIDIEDSDITAAFDDADNEDDVDNTATVTGADENLDPANLTDDAEVRVAKGALTLTKSATVVNDADQVIDSDADDVRYEISLTNTGTIALNNVRVEDTMFEKLYVENATVGQVNVLDEEGEPVGGALIIQKDDSTYYVEVQRVDVSATVKLSYLIDIEDSDITAAFDDADNEDDVDNTATVTGADENLDPANLTDDAEVRVAKGALTLTKSATVVNDADQVIDSDADDVRYEISLTNTGTIALNNVRVEDTMFEKLYVENATVGQVNVLDEEGEPVGGALIIQKDDSTYYVEVQRVDVSATVKLSYLIDIEDSDITAAFDDADNEDDVDNTATVTGADENLDPANLTDDAEVRVAKGALTLTKSATVVNDADQVIDSDADDVRYEISLTNTGTIALNNVRVEDTMFEKLYVENATVGQVNVLDEEGEPVGGALIIQKDDSTYYVEVQRVDVSATVKLSYLIDIEDSDITAAFDDADNEDDVDNTATVTGADENLDPANLTDDAEVRVAKGALTLTKSATVVNDADQVIDSDADDVRYEISLTNTGTIALNNVRVEDTMFEKLYVENATVGQVNVLDEEGEPVGGALIIQKDDSTYYVEVQRVDVSATVKLSYLIDIEDSDITAAFDDADNEDDVDNTATVTGADENLDPANLTDDAEVRVAKGALTLTKSATVVNDADQVIDSDADDVRYEISLTNTGTIALNNVRVEDTMFEKLYVENATVGQVNVLDEEGEPVGGALIIQKDDSTYYVEVQRVDVSATVKLSYLIDIEDSDITAAFDDADNEDDVDNTATVTGADENLDPANLTDDAEVRVAKGALTLTKSATVVNDADQVIDSDADDVRYEISLTNTGTIALNNVRVEDTMFEKLYVENATVGQVNVLDEEGEPVGGALIIQKDDSTYYVEVQRVDVSATVKLSYLIDIEDSDITAAFDDADNEDDVDNTATVTGADENLDPANLTDDAEVRVAKGALTLTKSATVVNDADQVIDSDADDVRYEISLTNTGTIALNNVRVEDTMFEKLYVENATVGQVNVLDEEGEPVGGALIIQKDDSTYYVEVQRVDVSATVKLSYLIDIEDSDITAAFDDADNEDDVDNTATVTGADENLDPANLTDEVEVLVATPELLVTKSSFVTVEDNDYGVSGLGQSGSVDSENDVITYILNVKNNGNVQLTNINIYDSMFLKTLAEGLGEIKLYATLDDASNDIDSSIITTLTPDTAGRVMIVDSQMNPITLNVNDDYFIRYTYKVQSTDISSKGVDDNLLTRIDTPYAIDNVAKGYSDQIESAITYDTVAIRTPELTLAKTAIVTTENLDYGSSGLYSSDNPNTGENEYRPGFVDSENDVVTYTLHVTNSGYTTLSDVEVYDSMFQKTVGLGDIKLYATLDDANNSSNTVATLTPDAFGKVMIVNGQGNPITLNVNEDYFIRYTYTVQASDITGKGDDGNEDGEDYDIDNTAQASAGNVVSDIVSYAVNIQAYSDIAIYKDAVVTLTPEEITAGITPKEITAGTVGTDITYTLQVLNEGTTQLTGIRVYDQMFRKSYSDSDLSSDEQQLYVKVYGANGVEIENRSFDATVEFDQVTNDYFISFGDNSLNAGEYATISYGYVVSLEDFGTPANDTQSLFNYIQNMGPQGDPGDAIEMGYGTFTAYVNKVSNETYDVVADRLVDPDNVYNEAATVFANRDNTGFAIGVNAGVMAGDRNGNQDHLLMQFNPSNFRDDKQSLVEGVSIVFTNATTVELGFKAIYGNNQEFVGSLTIGAQGNQLTYNLKEVVDSQLLTVKGQPVMGYVFENSDPIPTSTPYVFKNELGEMYSLSVSPGPGGAQNLLYTLTFNPADSELGNVSSFDFWVVGDLGGNNQEQIKVVDVQFDVVDYGTSDLTNIAKVVSDQDNLLVSTDGGSDEVATVTIGLLSDLSAQDALIAQELGYSVESIKDDYSKILEFKNKGLSLSELEHISVNKDSNISDGDILSTLGIDENKVSINPPVLTAAAQSVQLVEAGGTNNGTAGVSTATIQMTASDPDGTTPSYDTTGWSRVGTTAVYTQAGTYGTASLDTSTGLVTYTLDNSKVVTQALDASEPARDTFAVKVGDGLSSTTTNAVFSITGSNDAPILTAGTQSRTLLEAGGTNNGTAGVSTATIQMTASDPDGTTPSYDTTGWSRVGTTAVYTQAGTYGTASLDTSTGLVTYTLDNSKVVTQALDASEPARDTFAVKVGDGLSSTTTNAVFSITGSNDAPILTAGTQSRTLLEAGGTNNGTAGVSTATIQMTASDPDGTTPSYDTTGWSRVGTTAVYTQAGTYGTASLDTSTGLVTYTLDNSRVATEALTGNESASDTFAVKVGDGLSSTTTNAVFSITGSNDIDTIAPYIISSTPADGSTGVSSGYSVRIITFNENIARGTSGTISLIGSKSSATASFDIVNDFVSNNSAPSNGKFSIIGDTLYIGASLQAKEDYYLSITTGALKDLSGNNLVLTNQSLNFTTPITFDLNNDGIEYLSTSARVTYDYNDDGVAESTAWVSPEDGLLALSQEDGSLKIVFSTQDGETDLQGLAKIYDSNQDGQLDELDTFFNQFGVWQDADSDGVVDSGEFQSLTDREIVSLDLVSDGVERTEAGGDVFVYGQTTYTKADGTTGLADDAAFVVRSSDEATNKTIQIGNSGEVVHVPDFGADDQIDLSTILANAAITRDNLKDYVQLVDGENGTVLNIDTTGHGGEGGWVQVASLDNVHVSQTGVNMFFDPTNQTIDFTQSSPDDWKVEDGDTPV